MMGGGMMGGGMMGGGMMGPDQGQELLLARFTVLSGERRRPDEITLPPPVATEERPLQERHTQLAFRGMQGLLNARRFEMTAVASDEKLVSGKPLAWTFANDGAGMAMAHPMHVHGVRFRILERRGGENHGDLRAGIIDAGYQDTTLVLPGERVTIGFAPSQPGLFMYHCHNLEHEDSGMMRNYLVGPDPEAKR
jgi:bilirubin oxidase